MTWLTWRQLRLQTAAVALAVGAFAVALISTGQRLHGLKTNIYDQLTQLDHQLFYAGVVVVAAAPAVIGAFWGAPLVAREIESGTHRLVWNQSVTRTRWLATKLGTTVAIAAAVMGLLTWVVTWWSAPIDGVLSQTHGSLPARLPPVSFGMRGIVPLGYVVFALTLGVALGLLIKRSLPAIAVTLALMVLVQVAVPTWVRQHLAPSVTTTVAFSRATVNGIAANDSGEVISIDVNAGGPGAWLLSSDTVDAAGRVTGLPSWFSSCFPPPPGASPAVSKAPAAFDDATCFRRLDSEGYRQRVVYQPASRFWRLQWTELGMYLVVSALLAAFSFWWLRRRLV